MGPNEKTLQKIRLISDNLLYQEAVDFVAKNEMPENSQLNGLLEYSRQWDGFEKYIKKQEDREWTGKKEHYKEFYSRLRIYLFNDLRNQTKNEFNLIPTDLVRKELQKRLDEVFPLLAQEYIRHLVAEALYKNATNSKKDSQKG